jgi:A/G-specific adenine glycosylase
VSSILAGQLPFWQRLAAWQTQHGRHGLPWTVQRSPYPVWLSEIMLQQTQVAAVMGYFDRFLHRFPTIQVLADAEEAEVMALWSGLGYYSRARNLHACAKEVVRVWNGEFPRLAAQLQTLPGIGPSTAAAIASLCFGERVAILDGNVKRVLARHRAYAGDLSSSVSSKDLLTIATDVLPDAELAVSMPRHTQGIMDLGAGVCTPRKPACASCPVADDCAARLQGNPEQYPVKIKKIKRQSLSWWVLWAQDERGALLVVKRPTSGIWGGLHCLPIFSSLAELNEFLCRMDDQRSPDSPLQFQELAASKHVLTHRDLHLHPVRIGLQAHQLKALAQQLDQAQTVPRERIAGLGWPTAIKKILGLQG